MNVRELRNFLELQVDESVVTKTLNTYSHWMAALFTAKDYMTSNPKDAVTLEKLKTVGVIELRVDKGQYIARLTKSGRALYQDFYGHGYYLGK